jgi:hypothetical protein
LAVRKHLGREPLQAHVGETDRAPQFCFLMGLDAPGSHIRATAPDGGHNAQLFRDVIDLRSICSYIAKRDPRAALRANCENPPRLARRAGRAETVSCPEVTSARARLSTFDFLRFRR